MFVNKHFNRKVKNISSKINFSGVQNFLPRENRTHSFPMGLLGPCYYRNTCSFYKNKLYYFSLCDPTYSSLSVDAFLFVSANIHPHSASFTYITHIDMDCFFVSVGLLSRPHLKNKPIAVTHHPADTPSVSLKRPGVDEEYERNYYKQKKSNSGSSSRTDLQGIR